MNKTTFSERMETLRGFIRKEFIHIFRDKKMIAVLFFIPTVQMIMFGLALTSEVKNIELAIYSKPNPIARKIQSKAIESGWFAKADIIYGNEEPSAIIEEGRTEAVLVFPEEGSAKIMEKGGSAQLLINAINAQRAQQINAYISQIFSQASQETAKQAGIDSAVNAIHIEYRVMYNHYLDTKNFMVPALVVMAGFMVILLVCAMSITKEKETGTMEKLIAAPIGTAEILAGKTIPYFIIGLAIMAFMLSAGIFGFGLPLRGRLWQLAANALVLDACALSIATIISIAAKSQQQAMMGCILVLLPSILLSGIMFPVSNIPLQFRWICYINPLMYGAENFRNAMLKGGDPAHFWLNSG
ncbi:MAG: ABC transporter permease, partial [Elusimicrobiales bacterium]|nr:ABC transporter permease [Elusimicrobiales bacterium]